MAHRLVGDGNGKFKNLRTHTPKTVRYGHGQAAKAAAFCLWIESLKVLTWCLYAPFLPGTGTWVSHHVCVLCEFNCVPQRGRIYIRRIYFSYSWASCTLWSLAQLLLCLGVCKRFYLFLNFTQVAPYASSRSDFVERVFPKGLRIK